MCEDSKVVQRLKIVLTKFDFLLFKKQFITLNTYSNIIYYSFPTEIKHLVSSVTKAAERYKARCPRQQSHEQSPKWRFIES